MQSVTTESQTALRTIGRSLARALCVVAAATLLHAPHALAQPQTPDAASARVIIKYKATSTVLKAAVPAEQKPQSCEGDDAYRPCASRRRPVDDRSHIPSKADVRPARHAPRGKATSNTRCPMTAVIH
jgi:hypothetical protein